MECFSYFTSGRLKIASGGELRATASEMETLLDELDYDSDGHTIICCTHIDAVNAINCRFPLNLLFSESGYTY